MQTSWQSRTGGRGHSLGAAILGWKNWGISREHGDTYRYIQFDVSRLGLPVNHSGANVIQPSEG